VVPRPDARASRVLYGATAGLIALLTLVIYGQTLSVPALDYEDSYYLIRNPYVNVQRPMTRLGAIWTEPFFANFHPVTTSTWVLDRILADKGQSFDARPFRATHLLYAALGALLVMPLLVRLGVAPVLAAAGAALFAAHPIHTDIVAWISARKDLIALILALMSMLAYISARQSRTPGEWWARHALTAVLTLLAVLAKPTAVVLPALYIAFEFCAPDAERNADRRTSLRRAAGLTALFAVVGGIFLFAFRVFLQQQPAAGAALIAVPLGLAALLRLRAPGAAQLEAARRGTGTAFHVFAPPHFVYASIFAAASAWTFWAQSASGAIKGGLSLVPTLNLTFDAMLSYIGKTFVPIYMAASYVWNEYPTVSARGVLGALLVAALVCGAWRLSGSRAQLLRAAAFGILWYLISFVPVSNLVPTSTKMADRYLFLPSVGAVIAVVALAGHFVAGQRLRERAALGALAVVVAAYTAGAYDRTEVWCGKTTMWKGRPHPDLSLWTRAVETHPDNHSALTTLGMVYLGFTPPEPEPALVYLNRALALSEAAQNKIAGGKHLDISPLHQALGHAYLELARGKLRDSRGEKREALKKSVFYLEDAARVPWGFPPSDARLLWRLSEAREEMAQFEDEEARSSTGEPRRAALERRDTQRRSSLEELERARRILLAAGAPRGDADFRAVVLAAGTAVFKREAGAPPEERRRHFETALALYQEAQKLFPDDPRPIFYQGLCWERLTGLAATADERQKMSAAADSAYRQALGLHFPTTEYHPLLPYRALASLYNSTGRAAAALEFLKQVRQADAEYSRSSGVDRDIAALQAALGKTP
jgi:tetratricopeptide (TPR) repeat protein